MRKLVVLAACVCALTASLTLEARPMKVGVFSIDGSVHHNNFILEDGNVYKPINGHQKANTIDWDLGDSVLVLKASKTNRYYLVNKRTGQKAKMKIIRVSSSSSTSF